MHYPIVMLYCAYFHIFVVRFFLLILPHNHHLFIHFEIAWNCVKKTEGGNKFHL